MYNLATVNIEMAFTFVVKWSNMEILFFAAPDLTCIFFGFDIPI